MIKKEIVTKIANETTLSRTTVYAVVESLFDNITKALANGDKVQFAGFGTFEPKYRNERLGRNPRTGEEVPIPARVLPSFKAGSCLKDAVIHKK